MPKAVRGNVCSKKFTLHKTAGMPTNLYLSVVLKGDLRKFQIHGLVWAIMCTGSCTYSNASSLMKWATATKSNETWHGINHVLRTWARGNRNRDQLQFFSVIVIDWTDQKWNVVVIDYIENLIVIDDYFRALTLRQQNSWTLREEVLVLCIYI